MKYIIDTDIGDDIDDAFALLFAMEKGLEIIGITTVFGNTEERARIAKKLMQLYGRGYENVPVFSGYGERNGGHLWQYTSDLQAEKYTPNSNSPADAVDFIISECKRWGDELTVIAIGPFTNIAKVMEKDKKALSLANRVIIMGGAYFRQYADWNVMCDPDAAGVMFDGLEKIRCIGADVTHKLRLSENEDKQIEEFSGDKAKEYAAELYTLWKNSSGAPLGVLHDPLAVYYAIDESACSFDLSAVEVITDGAAKGITLNVASYGKAYLNDFYKGKKQNKHYLAKDVDKEKIISEFMKMF